ncbi:26s proteasome non-atpase regulatory subunit [Anaeramoeba flamelloides]|uniref:26s proteasome non-atpase regulatory subunit n=1 Tax=Anaeramoeba flamelloides TaxID=1746091 RepID=A0AAV7YSY0_9EUKA|nr:26s proteasome non-atpase regulatory subunit [Anaeramoeba flamelloides]
MFEEITLIILDNSKFGNKNDFEPSRFDSQLNCLTALSFGLTQKNELNKIGLLIVSNPKNLLVQASNDIGGIFDCLSDLETLNMTCNYFNVVNFAAEILLKDHKIETKLRIILFVAGEINEESDEITKTGTFLKKNLIQIDIINFVNDQRNQQKLNNFQKILNDQKSHLLSLDPNSKDDVLQQIENSGIFPELNNQIEEEFIIDEGDLNIIENTDFNFLEKSLEKENLYQQRISESSKNETQVISDNKKIEINEDSLQKAFQMSIMEFEEMEEKNTEKEEEERKLEKERREQLEREKERQIQREKEREQEREKEKEKEKERILEKRRQLDLERKREKERELEREQERRRERQIILQQENEIDFRIINTFQSRTHLQILNINTNLSLESNSGSESETNTDFETDPDSNDDKQEIQNSEEDEQLKYVIQLSLGELNEKELKKLSPNKEKSIEIEKEVVTKIKKKLPIPVKDPMMYEIMSNWDFVNSVLKKIPNIDPNNKIIKKAWKKVINKDKITQK